MTNTLYFGRHTMFVFQETLDHFNLTSGQRLPESSLPIIGVFNANVGIAKCHTSLAIEKAKKL